MKFECVTPVLYTEDILGSIAFYTEKLGFENHWTWGNPPSFGGVYADNISLFFCKDGRGHPGTWICINVTNVDAYYETIRGKDVDILSLPEDKEWSMREMLVRDPDGHTLRFGHQIDCT